MKIFVHLTGELETAYKTLYIKWFQDLLPYMYNYKITDGITANDSDIIIVTIDSYRSNYQNNSRYFYLSKKLFESHHFETNLGV